MALTARQAAALAKGRAALARQEGTKRKATKRKTAKRSLSEAEQARVLAAALRGR
jgi:hypothetical protein